LPVINAFYIVATYGVNRPYIEEFFSTTLVAIAAHDGTLTLSQLLEPVNEHPYFFTKLILALHTNLTRFDLRVDMVLSVIINTVIFLILLWWLWKQDRHLALLIAPPLSLLVLTSAQAINWLFAFQNIFFISVLFLVLILSVILYLPVGWRAILCAMIFALMGSFSMGIAPAMWAAPLLTLWLRGYRNWSYYAVWFVLGGIIVGYSILTTKPLFPTLSLHQLDIFISFTFAYLGNFLFANNSNLSIVFGISGLLLLAVNAFLLWLKNPRWLAGWAGISSFSVISALMTSYGRGILMTVASNSPLQSRYVTHSVLMWVALLAISSCNALLWRQAIPKRRRVSLKLPAAILIFKTRSLICSISFFF
jgi:hypothetical protein